MSSRPRRYLPSLKHICLEFLIAFILTALVGCSADDYKRDADLQVNKLLSDRKQQTLSYQPKTEARTDLSPNATHKSYATLPVTPIPPTQLPPLEPMQYKPKFGPLGPQDLFPAGAPPETFQPLDIESARRPAVERLKLGPPAAPPQVHSLDLFSSVHYGIEHSPPYASAMEDLYLAALNVTLQQHFFEPQPFDTTLVRYDGAQRDVSYSAALAAVQATSFFNAAPYYSGLTVNNSLGVTQNLPYGGQLEAQTLMNFVNGLNDQSEGGESAAVALSGTIPLLRGAGPVAMEPLIESERQLVYQVRTFETFRRSFAVNVAGQYFALLTLRQAIANRQFNYVTYAELTERTQALYDAGRLNFLEVQRSLQSQLQAQDDIINAEDAYETALDQFKIALGMPVEEALEVIPVELRIELPDVDNPNVMATALHYRLDLQTARDQIEDARRQVEIAKNSLLPDLNISGGVYAGSRLDSPAKDIDARTVNYYGAAQINWPLDRLAQRNAYRSSLISLQRAARNVQVTRDQVLAAVRGDVRSIRSARSSVDIQQRGIELARRRLDYSTELLILGRATDSLDVVDAQTSLLAAQDAYDQAKANLDTQILQFLSDSGTLRVDPRGGALGMAMNRTDTPERVDETLQPANDLIESGPSRIPPPEVPPPAANPGQPPPGNIIPPAQLPQGTRDQLNTGRVKPTPPTTGP